MTQSNNAPKKTKETDIINIFIIIIITNGATAQSRALASLTGFVTVRKITMWVTSPTINLILVILIRPPETSSGEAINILLSVYNLLPDTKERQKQKSKLLVA
jgi:hypothetical protein